MSFDSFLAIDFETANPQRVSACSIGVVKVVDGQIVSAEHRLIHPVGGYSRLNMSIHHITEEMTRDAPTFDVLFGEFRADFENLPVLCYTPFDKVVFEALVDHYGIRLGHDVMFIDVHSLVKDVVYGLNNYKLPTVAYSLGIPSESHHDAKCDALQCARVFLKIGDKVDVSAAGCSVDIVDTFTSMVRDVLADGVVETWEARKLQGLLECISGRNRILKAVNAFLDEVLEDGMVSAEESDVLTAVLRYALVKLKDGGQGGMCSECDYRVNGHIAVASPEVNLVVPKDCVPPHTNLNLPMKFKERWEYVKAHPFKSLVSANVVITGDGVKISREKAEALVARLGGELKSSPTKAIDFCVVLGQSIESCMTGKVSKAREFQAQGSPVRIIDEDEFLTLAKMTMDEMSPDESI